MSDNNLGAGHVLLAFLTGAAAGAVAALLLAPKTGRETREQLAGYYQTGREKLMQARSALLPGEAAVAEIAPAPTSSKKG